MKFLIVEDQPMVAMLLQRYLRPIASDVRIATTMAEAKAALAEAAHFDIVTLDLNLPDSNAERTLDEIKNLRGSRTELVIIVITGVMNLKDAERIFRAGADGFLRKEDVSLHANNFLTCLREVVSAITTNPRVYQRNVQFLEDVCRRIGDYLAQQPPKEARP